jgi:lipoyl-dependent peroxiredoxin
VQTVLSHLGGNAMMTPEKILYTAKAHTTGGRDGGYSRTLDGRLQVSLSSPGTSKTGTNPEQLLAVGWSACFISAMRHVAAEMKTPLPDDVAVDVEVDLGTNWAGYVLQVRLKVELPGFAPERAQAIVAAAHETCPYSKATKGNIRVTTSVAGAGRKI